VTVLRLALAVKDAVRRWRRLQLELPLRLLCLLLLPRPCLLVQRLLVLLSLLLLLPQTLRFLLSVLVLCEGLQLLLAEFVCCCCR
jgi:hypothetical protein